MASPAGYAPSVPGLTNGIGMSTSAMNPMQMVAMLMGAGGQEDATTEKMAKIVQLLREVSKEDPRISGLVSDALKLLVEGPTNAAPPMAPGAPSSIPTGGPGGMAIP